MSKSILVVDDSLTIRSMLRRTVTDEHVADASDIVEASNGLEALDAIARQRFRLVILDMHMPTMDGLETLQAIRASPEHMTLPVVMLSGERNEAVVRRLVELGITDFVSKPFNRQQLGERLARIARRLDESAAPTARTAAAAASPGGRRRVLVVEQDADRRQFFVSTLRPRFEVQEAASGAVALKALIEPSPTSPEVVLTGLHVGLPPLAMFVTKLRSLPHMAGALFIRVVAAASSGAAETHGDLFDGAIGDSYVAEVLLADFQRVTGAGDASSVEGRAIAPSLKKDVIGSAEQIFGMMLAMDVEVSDGPLSSPVWPGQGLHAAIDVTFQGAEGGLNLMFRADQASARTLTGLMIGVSPADVQDEDLAPTAAEIVNIITGRLRNRLIELNMPAQIQIPTTWLGSTPAWAGRDADPDALELGFRAADGQFAFELRLSNHPMPRQMP